MKTLTILSIWFLYLLPLNGQESINNIPPGGKFRNPFGDTLYVLSHQKLSHIIASHQRHQQIQQKQELLLQNMEEQILTLKEKDNIRQKEINYWKKECHRLNQKLEQTEIDLISRQKKHKQQTWKIVTGGIALYALTLLLL